MVEIKSLLYLVIYHGKLVNNINEEKKWWDSCLSVCLSFMRKSPGINTLRLQGREMFSSEKDSLEITVSIIDIRAITGNTRTPLLLQFIFKKLADLEIAGKW